MVYSNTRGLRGAQELEENEIHFGSRIPEEGELVKAKVAELLKGGLEYDVYHHQEVSIYFLPAAYQKFTSQGNIIESERVAALVIGPYHGTVVREDELFFLREECSRPGVKLELAQIKPSPNAINSGLPERSSGSKLNATGCG